MILDQIREESEWIKKDGTVAKRPKVLYTCQACGEKANSANIFVDHIDPVVPLDRPQKLLGTGDFPWGEYISRLFCTTQNLWAICRECHDYKTSLENKLRREWGNYIAGKHDKAPKIRRIGKDFKGYTVLDDGCVGERPEQV